MKTQTKAGALILGLVLFSSIIAPQQAKAWDVWEDFVQPNYNAIRSNTVGRLFEQEYLGNLSPEIIEQLKQEQGGDWEYVVTDWCNNMATAQNPIPVPSVPYLGSTWRIEGGGYANCYSRVPN
jgi:hypothetical protein